MPKRTDPLDGAYRKREGESVRNETGIGRVGAGWIGSLHIRAYHRLFDHYVECPLTPGECGTGGPDA
jgi:hypothetical protein